MRARRFSLSNLSIKHRLPLLIGLLLLGIIFASTWASYLEVRESALEAGHQRLLNLTQQLASLSQQSTALFLGKTVTAANEPAIRAYLQSSSPADRPAALAILQQFNLADVNDLQVELWKDKSLVLSTAEGSSPEGELKEEFKLSAIDPFRTVGPIRLIKNAVVYPMVAAVKDGSGQPIGFLVRWRQVSSTPEARKRLENLLGNEAALYFGNTRGDIWTNLDQVVPGPPSGLQATLQLTRYARNGNSVMALGRPIGGTPFFVVVEFPDRVFLSQAHGFLRRVMVIDLAMIVLGVVGGFALSRSITGPLHSLTVAATRFSGGDFSQFVDIRQADELGALGNAFNSMAVEVSSSQDELKGKIQEFKLVQEVASKLAAIVEFSHDAIIGNALDGTITSWNQGAERLYGYQAEEVVGSSIAILVPPEHTDEVATILKRLRLGESIDHFETERIAKEGKRISVSLTISPIREESGVISGASSIARDITERKRVEEDLRRTNQRLEGALAELQTKKHELASMNQHLLQAAKLATMGELAASVAHELNNPLATLALHAESLANHLPVGDPKCRAASVIGQEVERMASLVSNLLLFSRRNHQQISTIKIDEELRNSFEFIDYHLRSHRINVTTDFAEDLPSLQADRQQLRQVFLNLLTNASDAMPEGGTLTVRARRGALENGAQALVTEFSDTGIGIKPEDLPNLWEPFFTTKPEGKGTGLGLLICRRMIEEHRGTIDIESLTGKGTTVRIVLPAAEMGIGNSA